MKHSVKLIMRLGACLASMGLAEPVSAAAAPANGWYWGLSGDVTWLRHSDTGGGGNIDLGYRFWPSNYGDFRLEAEAGYHGAKGSSGYSNTHYFTYMGNLYYDFNTMFANTGMGSSIVPYIGVGLGDAAIHFGHSSFANTFHHHENDFAYQGMAGLSYIAPSMPNTDWSLGYRYLGTDNENLHANNIELGMRFHF